MKEELKLVEGEIVPVYENEKGERLIDARDLHKALENKRKFTDWIKQRIEKYEFVENEEFICFHKFVKANKYGNKNLKEYLSCPVIAACGGSYMVTADLIDNNKWDEIIALCEESVKILKEARNNG